MGHLITGLSTAGYRQSRLFLKGPDKNLARYALGLSRKHLRVLTGLTGHVTLNRHLAVMKIRTDPICSVCGQEDETSAHFLGKCPATIMARHSIVRSYFPFTVFHSILMLLSHMTGFSLLELHLVMPSLDITSNAFYLYLHVPRPNHLNLCLLYHKTD